MDLTHAQLLARIWIDPARCAGKPCIRGHRIWVSLVLDLLASGATVAEIRADYPGLAYSQAAGTAGRYVVESRDVFGEGFLHYRVHHGDAATSEPSVVYYRQKCSNHPPRGCPLNVLAVDIVDLEVVKTAILHYVETSERSRGLLWRDITRELLEESIERANAGVTAIRPSGSHPR